MYVLQQQRQRCVLYYKKWMLQLLRSFPSHHWSSHQTLVPYRRFALGKVCAVGATCANNLSLHLDFSWVNPHSVHFTMFLLGRATILVWHLLQDRNRFIDSTPSAGQSTLLWLFWMMSSFLSISTSVVVIEEFLFSVRYFLFSYCRTITFDNLYVIPDVTRFVSFSQKYDSD